MKFYIKLYNYITSASCHNVILCKSIIQPMGNSMSYKKRIQFIKTSIPVTKDLKSLLTPSIVLGTVPGT